MPGNENIELSAPVGIVRRRPTFGTAATAEAPDDEDRAMEFHGDAG